MVVLGSILDMSMSNASECRRASDPFKEERQRTGIRLLWGTAGLFNPRFGATSPNADVFAYAATLVKKSFEVTHELNGARRPLQVVREWAKTTLI